MNPIIAKRVIVSAVLIIAGFGIRYALLQGAPAVSLKFDPVADAAYQSLQTGKNSLFLEQKDFTITQEVFFENKQWVVVTVKPIGTTSDPGRIILKSVNGTYQKVAGPSNFFQNTDLSAVPVDVANYVKAEPLQ